MHPLKHIEAGVLDIAYFETGPADGPPVFLMHGFPYDIHTYAEVAPLLADAGCRVIVPYLRGYGATRFLDAATPRSGEQAALGADLLALMNALHVPRAVLAGYDWGGRAACVVAALWPERCAGLVSFNSYNIQNIAKGMEPEKAENEHRYWYQYYFHNERGRAGLEKDRRGITRLLWKLWSPTWTFDDATFERSAAAFDHPDFIDVVVFTNGTVIDGQAHDQGWYSSSFATGGMTYGPATGTAPFPGVDAGGFKLVTAGGRAYYEFAISPIIVDPAVTSDVNVIFEVNTNRDFHWQDLPNAGYATNVFDVEMTSYEPVKKFGANSFRVFFE